MKLLRFGIKYPAPYLISFAVLPTTPTAPAAPFSLTRREALRRIIAATAVAGLAQFRLFGVENAATPIIGYDPNLLQKEIPWPRLLTDAEKRAVTALADLIIPADEFGPAASAVGITDFIDEWVSAPYEQQVRDRKTIRTGLAALDGLCQKAHSKVFAELSGEQQTLLAQELIGEKTELKKDGRTFFLLMRDRVAGGYYTTPEGWKALGYLGNTPQAIFAGPPPEALAHIGVA